MEIKTGYFAKAQEYVAAGYALVGISRMSPWFLPGKLPLFYMKEFAPPEDVLSLRDNPEKCEKRYAEEVLRKLNAIEEFKKLHDIAHKAGTDKVVLLCFEAPDKFCHRHLVAKWFKEKLGVPIKEHCSLKTSGICQIPTLFDLGDSYDI